MHVKETCPSTAVYKQNVFAAGSPSAENVNVANDSHGTILENTEEKEIKTTSSSIPSCRFTT